jgi:5-methylcytosine-specific restriction endonuclease McrA
VIRAKGKHDKQLRRCVPCYEKLQKYESARVRERNYKAEAFTNKHVIWNHYVRGAKKRSIHFALSKTRFNELIIQSCFYCGYSKVGEVNGIDRVDNNKGYIEENVVTCCQVCNLAKSTQHPQEFIDKLHAIHLFTTIQKSITSEIIEKWATTYLSKSIPTYKSYSKGANTRNIEFKLTEKEFADIVLMPCYLCGLTPSDTNKNGIDRFNNAKGYLLENCKPCCGHCNLLKKDMGYTDICRIAEGISQKYSILTTEFAEKQIPIRQSKTEARIRVDVPLVQEIVPLEYKPLNEIIVPINSIPDDIKQLLEKKVAPFAPKQWKAKQIHEAIQTNHETLYKVYCEDLNDIAAHPAWPHLWQTFVASIKGKPFEQTEEPIKTFIDTLRTLRHNQLCYDKNSRIIDKEDRQQWPTGTVVRAFLNGKVDRFKAFMEETHHENPEDPKWVKRWAAFALRLEQHRLDEEELKKTCSKFMTAQRIKRYRAGKE